MLIWLALTSVGIVAAFILTTLRGDPFPIVPATIVGAIGVVTASLAVTSVRRAAAGALEHHRLDGSAEGTLRTPSVSA
ncbi:MAG TPA: hypothetical protein VFX74_02265, partial [Candidatus Limnocylindria bacterium]|nr:hypothetical protein [Candidatus Limnocylindria bacterium]